jgi:hypothetical protein
MNLINKYNISEKDLYQLGIIESKKKSSGLFEKEKLKAASLKILKPYNVKFLDLGNLLTEIKKGGFDLKYSDSFSELEKQETINFIDKNSNVSNFYKEWWGGKSKKQKWILIVGIIALFSIIGQISGAGKPSECDCRKVMMYEDGAVDAAKRILGNSYGADFMERSQRECGLKYWDDIDKWQTQKGLSGTPKDNAMEYFMEKCK